MISKSTAIYDAETLLNIIYEDSEKIRIDKDPKLIQSLDLIKRYFTDYDLIWVRRDVRAVLASKMKAEWSKGKGTLLNLITSIFQYNIGMWQSLRGKHKIF